MRLIKAVKKKGKPFRVPNCSRDELPEFFRHLGFQIGAEIGVYKGRFSEKFCQAGLKMYAIDNWTTWRYQGKTYHTQERQDVLYGRAKRILGHYKDCTVVRKASMDAVLDFKSESLDFVYIDADHSFGGISNDIYEWYLRVRRGGIISGHDYRYTGVDPRAKSSYNTYCHVGPVVDAFVKAFGIDDFYIFGRSRPLETEQTNDQYLSWMFFKS